MTDFSNEELEAFRKLITDQINNVTALEDAAGDSSDTVTLDQSKVGRLSRMDALQQQAMAQATEVRRKSELTQLHQALKRLDDGSFGECISCLKLIDPRRVNHNPAVSLCLGCAEAAELKR